MSFKIKTFKWINSFLKAEILQMERIEEIIQFILDGDHDEVKVYNEEEVLILTRGDVFYLRNKKLKEERKERGEWNESEDYDLYA
jgi:hypothetical protein